MPARKPRVRSEKRTVTEEWWAVGYKRNGRPVHVFRFQRQATENVRNWPSLRLRVIPVNLSFPLPRGD